MLHLVIDVQKSLEMGGSGSENVFLDDEVFPELSPLEFRYPESSSIFDLDATFLLDNPSEATFPFSTDVLPDPTVASEGGILNGQAGEFDLSDQELTTMISLLFPDEEIPGTSSSNFQPQEMSLLNVLDQEISGISFSNFLSQELNSLDVLSHDLFRTSFLSFPTQELNSLSFSSQGLSMMDPFNFLTQELYLNTLELSNKGLSMMDTFGHPTQEAFMNPLEFSNPGFPMMDTLGSPIQETFMNALELPNQELFMVNTSNFPAPEPYMNPLGFPIQNLSMTSALSFSVPEMTFLNSSNQGMFMSSLEFQHQELSMLNALSLPAPELTSIGFPIQEPNMNTSGVPYQPQPVFMTMGDNRETAEMYTISSSDDEQLQEEFDPNYGNDNGASGSNSNPPLRQTLSKEMISRYFYMPINDAAKALAIGVTLLKSRCRELGFSRWPQRKLTSIQTLIAHLQEFGESSGIRVDGGVQERIRQLEDEKKRIEDNPDLPLEDDTIRLRQACFKSSHRKRKRSDRDH